MTDTLRITDLTGRKTVQQTFQSGALHVISRSGLHAAERLLLDHLGSLTPVPAHLLVAGNRTGVAAMAAALRFPDCAVTCHAFDLHHARAIARNLTANAFSCRFCCDPGVTVPDAVRPPTGDGNGSAPVSLACTATLPDGPFDAALFMSTPGSTTGELLLDQLEELHRALAPGGTCLIACETHVPALLKQVKRTFGPPAVLFHHGPLCCLSARKRGALANPRDFTASFAASLPGGASHTLYSLPGVFCHRRPDTGGLALAEVAARDLKPGARVLDMGCGCGLVGLLLAAHQPDARVTFVDSHSRALAATRRNLDALGLTAESLVLSDSGLAVTGFDLFAGNPPYYSDFRIADCFLRTARAALTPGGVCLTVAKTAHALAERQRELFGAAEILPRRGYGVVRSVQQGEPS
ncbi:MAG TPA: methyltransferase [Kiritimatiellia bacterium]|nr:methyltransferase [Kiritimatiellia bacterium]HOM58984.1 methyltransferase [Kiritimatiellia bacterium]HOR98628.1 methyltransferase [Kiritimatiellia bacterium]HPC48754.1 methyltransferase [Kiritimatiellia bacterium]HPK37798.1 methyltransferase [Kiritimatiellia bacterium]